MQLERSLPVPGRVLCAAGAAREESCTSPADELPFRRLFADRGLTALSGAKYGCDFALYRGAPGDDHSVALCLVPRAPLAPADVVRFVRLAQSVRKQAWLALGSPLRLVCLAYLRPQHSVSQAVTGVHT